jgi:hypothetical protein
MAPHGNKIPICLEQLTSKHTSDGCTRKPLSDNELLELYHAVNIRVRIAREAAMPDPRLQHLVVLCNLRDAISIGEYQLYLERARAYTSSRYTNVLMGCLLFVSTASMDLSQASTVLSTTSASERAVRFL